jgi:methylglutaconyl-CoA hydratase
MPLIVSEAADGIVTLTFNRAEKKNAFTVAMLEQLCAAIDAAAHQASARVLILRGAGDAFSTGFDLTEAQELTASLRHAELLVRAQLHLAESPLVCIAAVHGFALAGGGAIVAACDYVVSTEDAKFGYPVLKSGLVPTPGMPFLRHELRDRDLRTLVLGGELIGGKRALEIGLVSRTAKDINGALAEAHRFASLVLAGSPQAVVATKKFANVNQRRDLRAELEDALHAYNAVRRGPESAEGLRAFVEKRKPSWNKR